MPWIRMKNSPGLQPHRPHLQFSLGHCIRVGSPCHIQLISILEDQKPVLSVTKEGLCPDIVDPLEEPTLDVSSCIRNPGSMGNPPQSVASGGQQGQPPPPRPAPPAASAAVEYKAAEERLYAGWRETV